MSKNGKEAAAFRLPQRRGDRPRTTDHLPHSQLDQLVEIDLRARLSRFLLNVVSSLPHVTTGSSQRAPLGTIGLHLDAAAACGSERCFLLEHEFAHVHVSDDGSLHAILPESLRTTAIEKRWAEPHPLAGQPTVSPDTVMIYAPRDEAEVEIIAQLVRCSWSNAKRQARTPGSLI